MDETGNVSDLKEIIAQSIYITNLQKLPFAYVNMLFFYQTVLPNKPIFYGLSGMHATMK